MDWEILRNAIQGRVVTAQDPDFPEIKAAMVWNEVKPNRNPEVIVTVENDQDVVEAINFARNNNLRIAVHGGGHSWCGLALRHGGMTIDLSRLTHSFIDKQDCKAVIQPVISNRELAIRLAEFELAFPIGHCPTVKTSGYLLNGGMSWNLSEWGPACLSVEAVDFVTAEGKQIRATAHDYPDLFWASKGCGPGMFAVATRFYLKCYPLPKAIMTSSYYFRLEDLEAVVRETVRLGWTMPSMVELSIFLIKAPPALLPQCKNNKGKVCMVTAVAFADTKSQGEQALAILESELMSKLCLAKEINVTSSFEKLCDISGITWPEQHRNLCENQCSKANPVEILIALREKIIDAPSDKSVIVFCQSTGHHNLLQHNPNIALSMDGQSYGGCWSIWEKPEDDAMNIQWHQQTVAILQQFTDTHYIGETDIVEDRQRVQHSFTTEKWQQLEKIRAKYDPDHLFFGFFDGL